MHIFVLSLPFIYAFSTFNARCLCFWIIDTDSIRRIVAYLVTGEQTFWKLILLISMILFTQGAHWSAQPYLHYFALLQRPTRSSQFSGLLEVAPALLFPICSEISFHYPSPFPTLCCNHCTSLSRTYTVFGNPWSAPSPFMPHHIPVSRLGCPRFCRLLRKMSWKYVRHRGQRL